MTTDSAARSHLMNEPHFLGTDPFYEVRVQGRKSRHVANPLTIYSKSCTSAWSISPRRALWTLPLAGAHTHDGQPRSGTLILICKMLRVNEMTVYAQFLLDPLDCLSHPSSFPTYVVGFEATNRTFVTAPTTFLLECRFGPLSPIISLEMEEVAQTVLKPFTMASIWTSVAMGKCRIPDAVAGTTSRPPLKGRRPIYLSYSAAFDPIFHLQHANVDRIAALWQAIKPNVWVTQGRGLAGTFTLSASTPQDTNTGST